MFEHITMPRENDAYAVQRRRLAEAVSALVEGDDKFRQAERQFATTNSVDDLLLLHLERERAGRLIQAKAGSFDRSLGYGSDLRKETVKGVLVGAIGAYKDGKWLVIHLGTGASFGGVSTKEKAIFVAQELQALPYPWASYSDPKKMPIQQMRPAVTKILAAAEKFSSGRKAVGKRKTVTLSEPDNVIGLTQSGKRIIAELNVPKLVAHTRLWTAQDLGDAYILATDYAKKRGKDEKNFPGGMFRNPDVGGFYKLDRIYAALLERHPERRTLVAYEYSHFPGAATLHFTDSSKRYYKPFFRTSKGKAFYQRQYFSAGDAMTSGDAISRLSGG